MSECFSESVKIGLEQDSNYVIPYYLLQEEEEEL